MLFGIGSNNPNVNMLVVGAADGKGVVMHCDRTSWGILKAMDDDPQCVFPDVQSILDMVNKLRDAGGAIDVISETNVAKIKIAPK